MSNREQHIHLRQRQGWRQTLILEGDEGPMQLHGYSVRAQIRADFEQHRRAMVEITTQVQPERGRIILSLTERQLDDLFPGTLHPDSLVGYYDITLISPTGATRYLAGGEVRYTPLEDDHQRAAPELGDHRAPWWMDGRGMAEPHFMSAGVSSFWRRLRRYLLFPLRQLDPLTCSEAMLSLIAWDRGINRFASEPLVLYRKRVKYAFENARDAGDAAGFRRIFHRLGVGIVDIYERRENEPWDVITIELSDGELATNATLLQTLIQHYGRTCRRYRFEVVYPQRVSITAARFGGSHQVFGASL